jgi:NO-binding membrane sensor protein with MHYT domain
MLRVVGWITQDHDLGLIALACLVCVMAMNTSLRLSIPHLSGQQGALRAGTAVLAFSIGVWTTHFIGVLAYRPGGPVSFNVPLGTLSFILSIAATAFAFTIMVRGRGTKTSIIMRLPAVCKLAPGGDKNGHP